MPLAGPTKSLDIKVPIDSGPFTMVELEGIIEGLYRNATTGPFLPGAPMWMCAAVGAWSMVTFKEYLMESIMKVSMHIPMLIEFIVAGTSIEGVKVRLYIIGFDIGLIAGLIIIGLIIIGLPIIGLVLMPIIPMEGEPRSFRAVPAAVADC